MKDRSRAVATMVLHMSSQITSEGEQVVKLFYFTFPWDFPSLTLHVFLLAEAFIGVAVAGSMAGPDAVSAQASLVASGHRFGCRRESSVKESSVLLHACCDRAAYWCSPGGRWTRLCSPLHHRSHPDRSAGPENRWNSGQISLE